MSRLRAVLRDGVFAGDRRVWLWSALLGVPIVVVVLVWCLVPRAYYTGTDSVNALSLTPPASGRAAICQRGLNIPAGTRRIQLQVASGQFRRPALTLVLRTPGRRTVGRLPAEQVAPGIARRLAFPVGDLTGDAASVPASVCVRGDRGAFAAAVTPASIGIMPPLRVGGAAQLSRMAVWYLPRAGAKRSYLSELSTMVTRAAHFTGGFVTPVVLAFAILGLVPAIAWLAIRCLALAASGRTRRLALWLYVLAVLNAAAWSLITPSFQGPDEVDHYAYVQSVVENGHRPSPYADDPTARWSTAESDALLANALQTDHQANDTRAPWLAADVRAYEQLARGHPSQTNGGGHTAMSGYGPLYYLVAAAGYLVAPSGSVFTQLALARLVSALIGALATLFTYLLIRELVPRRPALAVLGGLLVGFHPMFGFLSGVVNNDVGVNAGSAAVAWLLMRLMRRGWERPTLIATGVLLGALPYVKDSAYDLFVLAAFAVLVALWRARAWRPDRRVAAAIAVGTLVVSIVVPYAIAALIDNSLAPPVPPAGAIKSVTTTGGALSAPLHAPLSYLSYLWQVFLPRIGSMTPRFPPGSPAQVIFIERGWAAFGWYVVLFPGWVYTVLDVVTLGFIALGIVALVRRRATLRSIVPEVSYLVLFVVVVIASFEAVFYTAGQRPVIAEMGRYVFPAMAPMAALGVGGLYAFGRRALLPASAMLLVVVLGFSYASQLLTFTSFFA